MKRIKMLLTVIAVTTLLSGCSFGTIEEQKTGDVTYEIVKKEEIPEQLKEEIKEENLQEALERTLEKYPLFRAVLRKGLFWFYLERRDIPAVAKKEAGAPCSGLYIPDKKTLLFRVSYYKNRINFEVFHALTDGTGAMHFLMELVKNYLQETHPSAELPELFSDENITGRDMEEDSFSQYYTGKKNEKEKSRPAYQITGLHQG